MVWGAGRLFARAVAGVSAVKGALVLVVLVLVVSTAAPRLGDGTSSHLEVRARGEVPVSDTTPVERTASPAVTDAPADTPSPTPTATPDHEPDDRTALIVGINRARGGAPLPGSITDAKNLERALLMYGFAPENITVLLDEQASRDAILSHLDALAARTPSDGLAVFAVATHTRRRGGQNELLTADGARISAGELGGRLAAVQAPTWVALPTCYAAGYAVPGITGPDRLATFASNADKLTYQLGSAGSYLFIEMVRKAMIEGHAPGSVEEAFGYAEAQLRERRPGRVPVMSDGVEGELVLGERSEPPPVDEDEDEDEGFASSGPIIVKSRPAPRPAPSPSAAPARSSRLGLCGPISVNCSSD